MEGLVQLSKNNFEMLLLASGISPDKHVFFQQLEPNFASTSTKISTTIPKTQNRYSLLDSKPLSVSK